MLKLLRAVEADMSEISRADGNFIFEDDTNYLHLDFYDEDTEQVIRKTVKAPAAASEISYSGTTSGLSATTVQGAIDEVLGEIPDGSIELSATDPGVNSNLATGTLLMYYETTT